MTVHELLHILIDADPNAEIIVSYHADKADEGAFFEDDVTSFSVGDDTMGRAVLCLLTDGFCEAVEALAP